LTRSLLEEFERLGVRGDIAVVVGGTIRRRPPATSCWRWVGLTSSPVTFLPDVVRRVQEWRAPARPRRDVR